MEIIAKYIRPQNRHQDLIKLTLLCTLQTADWPRSIANCLRLQFMDIVNLVMRLMKRGVILVISFVTLHKLKYKQCVDL